jgi:hypothetical protein
MYKYQSLMDIALTDPSNDYAYAKRIYKIATEEPPKKVNLKKYKETYLGPKVDFLLAIEASKSGYSVLIRYGDNLSIYVAPGFHQLIEKMKDMFGDCEFFILD